MFAQLLHSYCIISFLNAHIFIFKWKKSKRFDTAILKVAPIKEQALLFIHLYLR